MSQFQSQNCFFLYPKYGGRDCGGKTSEPQKNTGNSRKEAWAFEWNEFECDKNEIIKCDIIYGLFCISIVFFSSSKRIFSSVKLYLCLVFQAFFHLCDLESYREM